MNDVSENNLEPQASCGLTASAARVFLILTIALFSPSLHAAPTGQVEQIGFQNTYRPDCWTPMLVTIHPDSTAGNFFIQVIQEDLDRDRVIYQRPITLAGGAADQKFWTCFIPQPTDGGLPDASEGLPALQAKLKVYLADAAGKPIAQLPLTQPINNIDPPYSHTSMQRPSKLLLAVADAGSSDAAPQFDYADVRGAKENLAVLSATPADLPDDSLGYEALDTIVVMNVDPAGLKAENKFTALVQWVKEGGNLVICQNPQWQKMLGWGDLLPVTFPPFGGGGQIMQGSADRRDPGPILKWSSLLNPTTMPDSSFRVAVAQFRSGARIAEQIQWPTGNGSTINTPYLVRSVYGVGTVTWIAVDIGNPVFARANLAWPRIWQHISGDSDNIIVLPGGATASDQLFTTQTENVYGLAHGIDFGTALLHSMEHSGRSASLLLVAAAFLAIYWALAGPGAYLLLLSRRQVRWSWFAYAAVAVAATLLTFLVVKIALSGPDEIHHLSIIRAAANRDAVVRSRIGLYIPRDNPAEPISLVGTSGDAYITPYPIHPQQFKANQFAGYMQYTVNVPDISDETPPLIRVPFRSTLKKLQAKWIGSQPMIEGDAPKLLLPGDGFLTGQLTNGTGHELQDVYIFFHYPVGGAMIEGDWALYLPNWRITDTIDLHAQWKMAARLQLDNEPRVLPGAGVPIQGRIGTARDPDWERWWFAGLSGGSAEQDYPPMNDPYNAFVILSVFDRIPTPPNRTDVSRFEMQRRGARHIDASNIIAAGAMLILAHADGALPFSLEAGGQKVPGSGAVYYQMILPLDRNALAKWLPSTRPATSQPTTAP